MSYWAQARRPRLDDEEAARVARAGVPAWRVAYWELQRDLTRDFVLPLLEEHGALPREGRILEVGAGEAGCLAALVGESGLEGHALELSPERADIARALDSALGGGRVQMKTGDVTDAASLAALTPPYRLILLRDVIEHIEARARALQNLVSLLDDGGHILFTFPPYFSPFGAHQQLLRRRLLKLPWLQLSPLFLPLVRALEPDGEWRNEIETLRRCSLTVHRFERDLARLPVDVIVRRHYLLRPVFRYRYGLPSIEASLLSRLPLVRELCITGSWYLVKKRRAERREGTR